MKSAILTAALFASASLAWLPSCADTCIGNWDGTSCTSSSGWSCLCGNSTAIANINSCVASSCTDSTDRESIYGALAQICANAGETVTATPEATFSATSGGSAWPSQFTSGGPWGTNSAAWSSFTSRIGTALPGAPSGWGGNGPWGGPGGPGGHGGPGHGGPGGFGPAWTSGGPFNGGCGPWSSWSGAWGPSSQWTGIWSACSSSTASPSPATITTTVAGKVVTGTTFGIQAVSATATATSASGNAAPAVTQMAAGGAMVAALIGAVVAL